MLFPIDADAVMLESRSGSRVPLDRVEESVYQPVGGHDSAVSLPAREMVPDDDGSNHRRGAADSLRRRIPDIEASLGVREAGSNPLLLANLLDAILDEVHAPTLPHRTARNRFLEVFDLGIGLSPSLVDADEFLSYFDQANETRHTCSRKSLGGVLR